VVGVTHTDQAPAAPLESYYTHLHHTGYRLPVFTVDARRPHDMRVLLLTLVVLLDHAAQGQAA
jgi:hypothetical protein